ncbi:transposase [Weissella soli]|uniref:transposase n=1 Tax=Weissella soli TaxID=155866 RepID=UPI001F45F4C0|nr:transposase [Weissella soli]GJM47896.1 hypothetical protein WSSLDB02_04530 [Weissella soli]
MIRYKKEFKQSLVEMHNQGRSYTDLSAEYGPSVESILLMMSYLKPASFNRPCQDFSFL